MELSAVSVLILKNSTWQACVSAVVFIAFAFSSDCCGILSSRVMEMG